MPAFVSQLWKYGLWPSRIATACWRVAGQRFYLFFFNIFSPHTDTLASSGGVDVSKAKGLTSQAKGAAAPNGAAAGVRAGLCPMLAVEVDAHVTAGRRPQQAQAERRGRPVGRRHDGVQPARGAAHRHFDAASVGTQRQRRVAVRVAVREDPLHLRGAPAQRLCRHLTDRVARPWSPIATRR